MKVKSRRKTVAIKINKKLNKQKKFILLFLRFSSFFSALNEGYFIYLFDTVGVE